MTTDLKTIIEYIVNGESEKAKEMLHDFHVEKARSIYESLQEDAESTQEIEDSMNEIDSEETFGDDTPVMDDESFEIDGEADFDTEETDLEQVEDRVDNIEDELARLKAEFEELMKSEEDEVMESDMDDEITAEDEITEEDEVMESDADVDMDELKFEDITVDDEDYDDLEESFNLEAVKAHNDDGKFSNGKSVTQQSKSLISGKTIKDDAGYKFKKNKQPETMNIEVKKLPASKNPNKLTPVKVSQPVQPKGNKVSPISGRK